MADVGAAAGTFFIASKPSTRGRSSTSSRPISASNFDGVAARPAGDAIKLRKVRIALADQYGGSMPSGWTRLLLEQFEFPFEVVFPQGARRGQPRQPVRRDHLPVRRRTGTGRAAGAAVVAVAAAVVAAAAAAANIPGGVPSHARVPTPRRRPDRS